MNKIKYISFLDILGFGDLVIANDLSDVIRRLELSLRSVELAKQLGDYKNRKVKEEGTFDFFSFSDTFVLASKDDSPESFFKVFVGTALLTQYLFAQGMPVRGSLTKGEADYIPGTNHLVGKGIINAYKLEKMQNWFGVILDETIIDNNILEILEWELVKPLIVRWDVPIKSEESTKDSYAINWRFNLVVEKGIQSILPSPKEPAHQIKVDNTLRFCKFLRENNLAYGSPHSKTGEKVRVPWLAGCHVGRKPPGESIHGDEY